MSPVATFVTLVTNRPDVLRVFPAQPPAGQVMHLETGRRRATVAAPAVGFGEGGLTTTVPLWASQVSPVSLSPTSPSHRSNLVLGSA